MLLANLPIKYQIDLKAVGSVITFSWHTRTKHNNTDTLCWLCVFNSKSPLVQKSSQKWNKDDSHQTWRYTAENKSKQKRLLGGIMWSSVMFKCLCGRRCFPELCSGGVVIHLPETAYETCQSLLWRYVTFTSIWKSEIPQTHQVTDSRVSTGGHLRFTQQWAIKRTTFDID